MELEEARIARDEFAGYARSLSRNRAVSRTVLAEDGTQVLSAPQPLSISIGLALGEDEGDYGLAVRTTGPREFVDQELLPAMLARTENVDVEVIEPVKPRLTPAPRPGPASLKIGSSIGHRLITAGTLGAFVKDRSSDRVGILSNNHVMAATNQASIGDGILHPGPADGGAAGNEIGTLERFIPLAATNEVDAAFALLSNIPYDPGDIAGQVALTGRQVVATRRLAVCKVGRTTGFTTGLISAIDLLDIDMDYGSMWCSFDGQIEIKSSITDPFSAGGDSGSLVLTRNGDAVGLLFGGTTTQDGRFDLTFVNPIGRVLDLLDVDLVH